MVQWQDRYLILIAAALAVIVPVIFSSVPAYSASTAEPEERFSRVQLSAFMAPIKRADGRGGSAAVTPLLDLTEGTKAKEVCWLSPRIMDAFMTALHRQPIRGPKQGVLQTDALKKRLTDAANKALGRPMIGGVELVNGTNPKVNADSRFFKSAKCERSKSK